MTFYEAALRVLESEGRPLHFLEITEKSIAQNLLSHVGKMPEQTMLSRLAAMARRTRDRRVMVTAKDTFALTDWALPEDAEALAQTAGIAIGGPGKMFLLTAIRAMKFLRPVRPEEPIDLFAECLGEMNGLAQCAVRATCNGELVAEGQLVLALARQDA